MFAGMCVYVPRVPLEEDASPSRAIYVFIGAGAAGRSQWSKHSLKWEQIAVRVESKSGKREIIRHILKICIVLRS